jgi:hypothetical protein
MTEIPYRKPLSRLSISTGILLIWLGVYLFYGYHSNHILWFLMLPASTLFTYVLIGLNLIISGYTLLRKIKYCCIMYKFTCMLSIFYALDQIKDNILNLGIFLPYWGSCLIILIGTGLFFFFSKTNNEKSISKDIIIAIIAFVLFFLIKILFADYKYR